jgi:bifunctional non-homologous end joining protein LigD
MLAWAAGDADMAAKTDNGNLTIEGIKITHPDKVIFDDPEVTKLDVVRYYAAVSGRMLPYVRGRILSIVRCPKGIAQTCFYKKHPGPDSKGVVTVPVPSKDGETEEYFYIDDAAGLITEAQMGTLEFHTWGSRADDLEKPDIMVFDLDPDEGMDLQTVRRGVTTLKASWKVSLRSFLIRAAARIPCGRALPAASVGMLFTISQERRRVMDSSSGPLHEQCPKEQADE